MKKNMTNEEHFGDGSTGFSCGGCLAQEDKYNRNKDNKK